MRKDQVNVILEKVVEDSDTDAIDVRAYRGGVVQFTPTLVDENTNLTTPTLDIGAEVSVDGEVWVPITFATAQADGTETPALVELLDTGEYLPMYLRFNIDVGGSGYDDDNETEADQAYWNIELKVILWD